MKFSLFFLFSACSMNWNPNDVFCWTNQFNQLFSSNTGSRCSPEKEGPPADNNTERSSRLSPPTRAAHSAAPVPCPADNHGTTQPTRPEEDKRNRALGFYLPDLMTPPPPLSSSSTVSFSK